MRAVADVACLCGTPWALTYEEFFGLWCNRDRMLYLKAAIVLMGTEAAGDNEPLPSAYADALAKFDSEAPHIHDDVNAARALAKARERVGP